MGLFKKLFGVGPIGAAVSLALLAVAGRVDRSLGHPELLGYRFPVEALGAVLVCTGLALHFWSMYILRSWWVGGRLCTAGPFRWFRHPMYAAWITFVCPGIAFCLDSWVFLVWAAMLHVLWHRLVESEEKEMEARFHNEYRRYADRTGRFLPRPSRRRPLRG